MNISTLMLAPALAVCLSSVGTSPEHQIGLLMELGLVEETPLVNPVRKR